MECSKISQFYWIHLMILEKTRPCFWTLEPGSRTYGSYVFCVQVAQMKFVGPGPQSQVFFIYFMILLDFFYDSWEKKVLFVKIQARVLDLWLDTSFGSRWPKQPNVVSRPQAPRSRIFSRFHDFLGFISWLLRKWGSLLGDNVPSS